MKRKTNYLAASGLIVACILVSGLSGSESVSAYSASITTSNSVSFDVSPSGDGTSIHSESINVQSDCRSGYNLTIATPSGSSLYKYENNTQAGTASFTAVDGTSALNSSSNTNKWGYTLTANPTSSTVFSPLSSTQSVLKTPSQTASPSSDINDTFDISYGVKVDNTVAPGNYQMASNGAVVYYLTMDTTCTQYTVSFNPNGGTVADGGNNPTQGIEAGTATKLSSADSLIAPQGSSYTDAGNNTIAGEEGKLWVFWGWNTSIDGTGDWYKDREEVEDLASVGSTVTLYAQWKQATLADMVAGTQVGTEKVINHNEMQDMSAEACYNSTAYATSTSSPAHAPYDASTNPNGYHTITLLDYRGKVITGESPESPEQYTVSKLPDNLCWMTKDLNLGRGSGGANNDGTVTLTSEDTDLADDTTFTLPASPTTYTTGTVGYRTPQILINHTVTSYTVNSISYSPTIGHYSWAAATATNTSISDSGEVATSICPKNWDLPNRMQFYNLRTKGSITSAAIAHAAPYSFVYGGYRNSASGYYGQTSYGYYWTSSNSSSNYGYWSYIYSSGLYNGSSLTGYKYYGAKTRCVASQGKVTVNYDGNGTAEFPVTGTTASQINVEISSTDTSANGFTRTGWTFNGWNTQADGSGIAIAAANASTTNLATLKPAPSSTITLYAQWLPQYTITYVNNCKSWASADTNCTDSASTTKSNQEINLQNDPSTGTETGTLGAYNKFTLTGWKIKEWTTNTDGTGTVYLTSSVFTVPAGSSAGSGITLYAHWVPIYTIQYDGNGSDNDSTGMGSTNATTGIKTVNHTNVGEGDTFDLFASNFKKTGYGFVGWSTDANAWTKLTDNDSTNDAKIWGPNEIITAPAYNGTPITTLYAVWAPAETSGGNPVYLQGWTGCSAMTATVYDSTTGTLTVAKNSVTALTDERDGNVYAVAKLADGNCWMIENLRLDNTSELSITNTNIDTNNSTLPITNEYGSTTSNYLSPTSNSWCITDSSDCDDQSRLNTTNTVANITPSLTQDVTLANGHADFNATVFSYGNYYNWYSATAGYGTYSFSGYNYTTDGDICPVGWKLPIGGYGSSIGNTKGGFYYLANRMDATPENRTSSNRFRSFPNNFVYSDRWFGSSASELGKYGYYWAASAVYTHSADVLRLRIDNSSAGSYAINKYLGASVRCVVDIPHTVTVNLGANVQSVTFVGNSSSQTVSVNGGTVTIMEGREYTISATYDYDYAIDTWSTTSGTIGSTTSDPTTYRISEDATLSITSKIAPYVVQYDGNGSDNDATGMGSTDANTGFKSVRHTDVDEGDTFDLFASNFKKAGYGFVGWSLDSDAWNKLTDNDATNDAEIWGPNEMFTAPSRSGSILTLYAVWVPAETSGGNPVYLQGWTGCSAMTATAYDSTTGTLSVAKNSVTALTDERDGEVYAVAKLADENCWMIENLRLDNSSELSTTNTNIKSDNSTLPITNIYDSTTSNYLSATSSSWCRTWNSACYNQSLLNTTNTATSITPSHIQRINSSNAHADFNTIIYSYGNYYNWYSATAGYGTYSRTTSTPTDGDLCPAGWKLPYGNNGTSGTNIGNTKGGFYYLADKISATSSNQTNSNKFRMFPNNFIYSGNWYIDAPNSKGDYGNYWSASADSYYYVYYLYLNNTSINSGYGSGNKYDGFSIRCVAAQ